MSPFRKNAICLSAFSVVSYIFLTWITDPLYWGDSPYYAQDVLDGCQGNTARLVEFGHLFWRPLAFLMIEFFSGHLGGFADFSSLPANEQALLIFGSISWISGLGCALVFSLLLARIRSNLSSALVGAVFTLSSLAFLNYSQTGAPYIPGLFFLALGILLFWPTTSESPFPACKAVLAGVSLACSVLIWTPFILSLPAIFCIPLGVKVDFRQRLRFTAIAGSICILLCIFFFGLAIWFRGFTSVEQVRLWVDESTHGKVGHGGIPRTIFGLSGSFIEMGSIGKQIKRYLLQDPLNPLSFFEVFSMHLLPFISFYTFLLLVVFHSPKEKQGRQLLLFFLAIAAPNLFFAVAFDGGSPERYLCLLAPLSLLLTAVMPGKSTITTCLLLLLAGSFSITNLSHLNSFTLQHREDVLLARLGDGTEILGSQSLLIVSSLSDELVNLHRGFLYDPRRKLLATNTHAIINVGTNDVINWKPNLAELVIKAWDKGEHVWASKRLLALKPSPDWGWIEGEDPRVTWMELHEIFSSLSYIQEVGGADGFALLIPSEQNREMLKRFAGTSQFAKIDTELKKKISLRYTRWH